MLIRIPDQEVSIGNEIHDLYEKSGRHRRTTHFIFDNGRFVKLEHAVGLYKKNHRKHRVGRGQSGGHDTDTPLHPSPMRSCLISHVSFDVTRTEHVPVIWQMCLHVDQEKTTNLCFDIRQFAQAFVLKQVVPGAECRPTLNQMAIIVAKIRGLKTVELAEFVDPSGKQGMERSPGRDLLDIIKHQFNDTNENTIRLRHMLSELPGFDDRANPIVNERYGKAMKHGMRIMRRVQGETWHSMTLLRIMFDDNALCMEFRLNAEDRGCFSKITVGDEGYVQVISSGSLPPNVMAPSTLIFSVDDGTLKRDRRDDSSVSYASFASDASSATSASNESDDPGDSDESEDSNDMEDSDQDETGETDDSFESSNLDGAY